MNNQDSLWNGLTMAEKSAVMREAVKGGIYTLGDIRKWYDEGGYASHVETSPINIYKGGGYKPSDSIKKRIAAYEGAAMTGAIDPLSGKWDKNDSFENEAMRFYAALPESIREKVLSNPELADNLYSYSYNVGAGNFKKRVVPALTKYYEGKGGIEEVTDSMWASGDAKLAGLRRRRNEEKEGVRNALGMTNTEIPVQPVDNTFVYNPLGPMGYRREPMPVMIPDEKEYVKATYTEPVERERQDALKALELIRRIGAYKEQSDWMNKPEPEVYRSRFSVGAYGDGGQMTGGEGLNQIKARYQEFEGPLWKNEYGEGGEKLPLYSSGRVADILWQAPWQEYLGEPSHHYDFTQSEEWADAHGYYPDARGHRDDRVKKPAHPSHPSKGTWAKDGRIFNLTDIGMEDPNYIFFGLADGGQDPQATLMYNGATVLPELTVTPKGNYYLNPYDNIRLSYAEGGNIYDGESEPTQQMKLGRDYWQSQVTEPNWYDTIDPPVNGKPLQEIIVTPTNDQNWLFSQGKYARNSRPPLADESTKKVVAEYLSKYDNEDAAHYNDRVTRLADAIYRTNGVIFRSNDVKEGKYKNRAFYIPNKGIAYVNSMDDLFSELAHPYQDWFGNNRDRDEYVKGYDADIDPRGGTRYAYPDTFEGETHGFFEPALTEYITTGKISRSLPMLNKTLSDEKITPKDWKEVTDSATSWDKQAIDRKIISMPSQLPLFDRIKYSIIDYPLLEKNEYSEGGSIYIKPSHRGKFTALKERTGHSATWFKEHGTPAQKKMATFALNSRHWNKHALGGPLVGDDGNIYDDGGEKSDALPEGFLFDTTMPELTVYGDKEKARRMNNWLINRGYIPQFGAVSNGSGVFNFTPFDRPVRSEGLEIVSPEFYALAGLRPGGDIVAPITKDQIKNIGRAAIKQATKHPSITLENATSITPKQWTAAQDAAVARGDMAEAQRLRDLHFKVSAPDTQIKDIQYHSAKGNAKFNVFDPKLIGQTDQGWAGRGYYFTPSIDYAKMYGSEPRAFYINAQKVHDGTAATYFGRENSPAASAFKIIRKRYNNDGQQILDELASSDAIRTSFLQTQPYKGSFEEVVTRNNNQMKLADAVTYDDNGVRIPLGERDNFNINDVRYGLLPFGIGLTGYGLFNNKETLGGRIKKRKR